MLTSRDLVQDCRQQCSEWFAARLPAPRLGPCPEPASDTRVAATQPNNNFSPCYVVATQPTANFCRWRVVTTQAIAKRPNVFNPRQVVAVQPRDNFIPYAAHNQHIILAQLRDNNAEFWLAVFTIHFSVFSDARIHAERHDIAHIKYRVNRRLTPIFHPTPKTTDYTWHWSQLQLLLIFLLTFKNIGLPVIRTDDPHVLWSNALSLSYIGPMKKVIMNFHMVLHSQGSLPGRHARSKF